MSIQYAMKELSIRRHRTMANCIGIAISVALIISLYTLSGAYKEAVKQPFEASGIDLVLERPKSDQINGAGANGIILPDSAAPIDAVEVQALASIDGIDSMATSLLVWSLDKGNFKVAVGIDPNSPKIGPVMFVNWIADGRFFDADEKGVAVVEKHYAKSYGIKVGDSVDMAGEAFQIVGTVAVEEGSQLSAPNFFLPIDEVRRLSGTEDGAVNAIYIRLSSAADTKAVSDEIKGAIPGIGVSSPDASLSVADSLFSLSEQFTWLISIVVVIVAAFLIFKTVSSSIFERTKEIGIMKAVGWTGGQIRSQLTLEMLIQAIVGGILGIICGLLASFGFSKIEISAPLPWQGSPIPGSAGMIAADAEMVRLQLNISPSLVLLVFGTAIVVAMVCSVMASRRASNIKPAEALRKI